MSYSQVPHLLTPLNKTASQFSQSLVPSLPVQQTVAKGERGGEERMRYDLSKTPNVGQQQQQHRKSVVFFGNNHSKHLFPLYKDDEIGIKGELQRRVHSTHHDDDRMTTTTQLGLAISQTCEDLFEVLHSDCSGNTTNSLTQTYRTDYIG